MEIPLPKGIYIVMNKLKGAILLLLALMLCLSLASCRVGGSNNNGNNGGGTTDGEGGGEGGGVGGSEITGDDEPFLDDNGWTDPRG